MKNQIVVPILNDEYKVIVCWGDPDFYKKFNPENGWGSYEGLVDFVEEYLSACKENPDAVITVSR